MRVLLAHAISQGSTYYRIQEPARAVREADLGIEVVVRGACPRRCGRCPTASRWRSWTSTPQGADVVVLQLPKTLEMLQTQRVLQAKGVAVVVEMDDLLSGVPYGHIGHNVLVRARHGDTRGQARPRGRLRHDVDAGAARASTRGTGVARSSRTQSPAGSPSCRPPTSATPRS